MKHRMWPRGLALRLALMFALVSTLLLGGLGFYLYQSLAREVAWRDDAALVGRVERMRTLIGDSESIEALRQRPQLYANMLGNQGDLLWVLGSAGQPLIEINPGQMAVPLLPAGTGVQLQDSAGHGPARLAWHPMPRSCRCACLALAAASPPTSSMRSPGLRAVLSLACLPMPIRLK